MYDKVWCGEGPDTPFQNQFMTVIFKKNSGAQRNFSIEAGPKNQKILVDENAQKWNKIVFFVSFLVFA